MSQHNANHAFRSIRCDRLTMCACGWNALSCVCTREDRDACTCVAVEVAPFFNGGTPAIFHVALRRVAVRERSLWFDENLIYRYHIAT